MFCSWCWRSWQQRQRRKQLCPISKCSRACSGNARHLLKILLLMFLSMNLALSKTSSHCCSAQTECRGGESPCQKRYFQHHFAAGTLQRLLLSAALAAHVQHCARRKRPFLIRPLENTLIKLLKSLDFYDDEGRIKIAIGATRLFP